ncbi:MAG: hypothetical protein A2Z24_02860 [Candidatus Woykebacteria bacterium RBG_16_44_10]|uniref:Beta-lactamase class A catalytic domain-containing protein n=1 Tax=Candidatus Woykebacteria bacterium RBG_16_44_10 TaxID=1802597 RepID=A0A1G1WDP6_9BACT|nr:MAG: hypothetical protein A2Z24_02860 [Candidatus Woykebacteria bacterium RBG_16_44_10]
MKKKLFILAFLLFLGAVLFISRPGNLERAEKQPGGLLEKIKTLAPQEEEKKEVDLSLLKEPLEREVAAYSGEVAVAVTDLKTGQNISINGEKDYFPASSIKILILARCLKDVEDGKYKRSQVDSLLSSMMSVSSNYAANTLMVRIGLEKLSKFPEEIGMKSTVFIHGFSDGDPNVPRVRFGANNLAANDANLFWQELFEGKILGEEMRKKMLEYAKLPKVKLIYAPEEAAVYHKPGYIGSVDAETYIDAGVVETERFSYVVSFFSRNNPTHQAGADFGQKVTKVIYEWFAQSYQ